jgi:flagellin-like protein
MYIGAKIRFSNFVDNLKKDETGVSSIVATVLLILIVVLLAAVFWEKISGWFETMWTKITGQADTIGN